VAPVINESRPVFDSALDPAGHLCQFQKKVAKVGVEGGDDMLCHRGCPLTTVRPHHGILRQSTQSAEAAGDVIAGATIARIGENLIGGADLDQNAEMEERGAL
jgi:hypothetical protein